MAKIAIIGAGQVGAATAFHLATTGAAEEIALIDINGEKAAGEALDIAHGLPARPPVKLTGGAEWDGMDGAALVIMTAGANQRPEESRRELAGRNLRVLEDVMPRVARHAPDAVVLVVTNPVDALTHAAIHLTGFGPGRVFGSGTSLDTLRFRWMLAGHTGLDPRSVHAWVLGEHGDSELPAWSAASIAGMDIRAYCEHCGDCEGDLPEKLRGKFDRDVRRAAYEIIARKGATSYGIAMAAGDIARAVLRDEHAVFTVSTLLDGQYGLTDVCLSLPCAVGRRGVERVLPVRLSAEETVLLRHSADVIRAMSRARAPQEA